MHSLDAVLKPLILKGALIVILGVAAVISIPVGILVSRRLFREKPARTRLIATVLLTGTCLCIATVGTAYAGLMVLVTTVIEPGQRRDCAASLQEIARRGAKWAEDHEGRLPVSFAFLSGDSHHIEVNICRRSGANDQEAARNSYQLVSPGARAGDASAVFVRCTYHEHSVRADGTVVADKTQP